jgi:hypothetical protein
VDDAQRIDRLTQSLNGTGATVNGPFQVWGQDAAITDAHLDELSGWADLEHLVLSGCPITDDALSAICRFQRLKTLDIGRTQVTSTGISSASLPTSIFGFGLSGIYLTDDAVNQIAALPELRSLNCNGCGLSMNGLFRLVAVPGLRSVEALGCQVPESVVEELSRLTPGVLVRLDSGVWKGGDVTRRQNAS